MRKHTPGPWVVVDGYYPSFREISGPSFKVSAVMWANDLTEDAYNRRMADLRLISAAPELLEALEKVVKEYDRLTYMVGCELASLPDARAAIRKAKGEE